jgi:drug/metabolite transporter (DMT)-like permease
MLMGFIYALGACLLWGTIFVAPQFLPEYSPMEVALGRYFSFGLFSLVLLFIKKIPKYPFQFWFVAASYGLIANVLYYIGVVIGVRYATPPVAVLVIGMCPVVAAIYGTWGTKELNFKGLILSCMIMTFGIILVNIMEVDWSFSRYSFKEYLFGLGGSFTALMTWGWYAVQNARFLKKNPTLSRTDWASMIGVSTLFWVLILGTLLSFGDTIDLRKFNVLSLSLFKYFGITTFLGIVCAWVGCFFWNKASSILPISLMGPMIIFETLFGLFFCFLCEKRVPSTIEFAGIVAMIVGIYLCIAQARKKSLNPQ